MKKTLYKSILYLILLGLFVSLCSRKSDKYISQALFLVDSIDDEWSRNTIRESIAIHYADIGQHDRAVEYANTFADLSTKDRTFFSIAFTHFKNGEIPKAMETIEIVTSDKYKITFLTSLAHWYADSNNLNDAWRILKRCHVLTDSIYDDSVYVYSLVSIAGIYIKLDRPEIVDSLLTLACTRSLTIDIAKTYIKINQIDKALDIIRKEYESIKAFQSEVKRYHRLFRIVALFVKCNRQDLALNTVAAVNSSYYKGGLLEQIVEELANKQQYDESIAIVSLIEDTGWQEQALFTIAMAYAKSGDYTNAMEIIKKMTKVLNIVFALSYISEKYHQIEKHEIADSVFNDAVEIASSTDDNHEKSTALLLIAREYRKREIFHQANSILHILFETARLIEEDWQRDLILRFIADEYIAINECQQAETVINEIKDNKYKIYALLALDGQQYKNE